MTRNLYISFLAVAAALLIALIGRNSYISTVTNTDLRELVRDTCITARQSRATDIRWTRRLLIIEIATQKTYPAIYHTDRIGVIQDHISELKSTPLLVCEKLI